MQAGVVRVNERFGTAEIRGPITREQAEALADLPHFTGRNSTLIEVSPTGKSITPTNGVRKTFDLDATAGDIETWVNSQFKKGDKESRVPAWVRRLGLAGQPIAEKIDEWVAAIRTGGRKEGLQRDSVIDDEGGKLTPEEAEILKNNPLLQQIHALIDRVVDDIVTITGNSRLRHQIIRTGTTLRPTVYGIMREHPNSLRRRVAILLNTPVHLMNPSTRAAAREMMVTLYHEIAHVDDKTPTSRVYTVDDDIFKDPDVSLFLNDYVTARRMNGEGDLNHDIQWLGRMADLYERTGREFFRGKQSEFEQLITSQRSGGYHPEVQKILQIYSTSRGRRGTRQVDSSRTDIESTIGTGPAGAVPSSTQATGAGATPQQRPGLAKRIKQATGWGQGGLGEKPPSESSVISEALAVPSAVTTTGDFSFPGRQGLGLIHTRQFWVAFGRMFKGMSYESYKRMNAELENLPIAQTTYDPTTGKVEDSFAKKNMGLVINEVASEAPMSKRAENAASRWLEVGIGDGVGSKIWKHTIGYPVRMTNRMFITMSNQLKFNRAQFLVDKAQQMAIKGEAGGRIREGILPIWRKVSAEHAAELNPYNNLVLAKEIGDFVNTATGQAPKKIHIVPYGRPHNLESASKVLNATMFSPGLFFSRARMLSPATYIMASPQVRKQYLQSALAMAGAWYAFTELMKNSGQDDVTVSNDPTNSDFGKVRIGNTRLDPGGGFLQFLVLYGRAWKGGYTSSSNPEQGLHQFGKGYQPETQRSNVERFLSNKLNPAMKFIYDWADASEGRPFHMGDRTLQLFVPLFAQDLWTIGKSDPDLLGGMMQSLGPLFGLGTQTYSKGESISKFISPRNDIVIGGGGFNQFPGARAPLKY
jgi:hypothetical protein